MSLSTGPCPACGLAPGTATSSAASASALAAALRRENKYLGLVRRGPEALADRKSGNPHDFATTLNNGYPLPFLSRNLVVSEHVLERFRPIEARWADPVAVAPGPDRQRGLNGTG